MVIRFLFIVCLLYQSNLMAAELIQTDCSLFEKSGVLIKKFPGFLCTFLENGDRVEIDRSAIKYINAKDEVIWSKPGLYHHQVKLDLEGGKIVTLGESSHEVMGCKTRFDTIEVFNLKTGESLPGIDFYFDFKKYISYETQNRYLLRSVFQTGYSRNVCESTHVNSIFQIKHNGNEKYLKKGNWVVNFYPLNTILIFDNNFEKLLWKKVLFFKDSMVHDVQYLKDGKFYLYANNLFKDASSMIISMNATDKQQFTKYPILINGKSFYQVKSGGFDYFKNGDMAISIHTEDDGYQVGIFNRSWKLINKFKPYPFGVSNKGLMFQEPKVVVVDKFLKNYQGQQ
jgi:hypothetical protein